MPNYWPESDSVYEIFRKKLEMMEKIANEIYSDPNLKLHGKPASKPWLNLLQVVVGECMGYSRDGKLVLTQLSYMSTKEEYSLSEARKQPNKVTISLTIPNSKCNADSIV
jgi:hypothetical protein